MFAYKCVCYQILHNNEYVTDIAYCTLAHKMCMLQIIIARLHKKCVYSSGCNVVRNVACMYSHVYRHIDIHGQGNTARRCLRSFHVILAVTAGDREG